MPDLTTVIAVTGAVLAAASIILHVVAPRTKNTIDDQLRDDIDEVLAYIKPRAAPAEPPSQGAAPKIVPMLAALLLGAMALQSACADLQPRERAAAGAGALLDCEAPTIADVLLELIPLAKQAVMAAISGDGHADTTALRAAAAPLKSDLGRCALATAIAILATPESAAPGAPAAAALVVDTVELRRQFTALRVNLGWAPVKTRAGVL